MKPQTITIPVQITAEGRQVLDELERANIQAQAVMHSIRIPEELTARARAYAEVEDRSFSYVVRKALEEYMDGVRGEVTTENLQVGMIARWKRDARQNGSHYEWATVLDVAITENYGIYSVTREFLDGSGQRAASSGFATPWEIRRG